MTLHLQRQRGFTLAELMIAVAIGLVLLAAMSGLFMSSTNAQTEIEKANRQIENGRYAIQLLSGDLRNAGFLGEIDPGVLAEPAAMPDPCETGLANLRLALSMHVQGSNDATSSIYDCLSDVRTGTDILVVRHAATCVAGEGTCDAISAGGPYFQSSLCNGVTELGAADSANFYRLETDTNLLDRTQRNCTTVADIRRYQQYIYFVANNNNSSDGVPTLKRAEITSSGNSISYTIAPLVEGIENMQIEYGMDTSSPVDGVADVFTNDPGSIAAWKNVVSVRLNLLSRNLEKSLGYTESRTYTLGNKTDGTANTVSAGSDGYKRHVFQALVGLANPAGRRMN